MDKGGGCYISYPGLHNKLPQTEGLQKTHLFSHNSGKPMCFPELQNQGVNRVGSYWRP